MGLPKIILVPTDLSPGADLALAYAEELAAKLDATIHLLNVVDLQSYGTEYVLLDDVMASLVEGNQKALDKLVAEHRKTSFGPPRSMVGEPRMTILDVAGTLHADLIVMGTHGRRGVKRLLLGSVAEAVARIAPCPVLLVREKPARETAA